MRCFNSRQYALVGLIMMGSANGALAQFTEQNNSCLQAAGGQPGSFVVTAAGERLSNNEFILFQGYLAATTEQTLRACIAVAPSSGVRSGVINVRIQTSLAANETKSSVDYPDQVELQNSRSRSRLPSVSISTYQNYHQCPGKPDVVLDREFHESIGAMRTNDPIFRNRFLFEKDVTGSCNIVGAFFDFLGHIPVVGQVAGAVVGSAFAGSIGLQLDRIVKRRSIIVKYTLPESADKIQYISREIGKLRPGYCIRVESTDMANLSQSQIVPSVRLPFVLGSGCIAANN